jgi:hypothetical protein
MSLFESKSKRRGAVVLNYGFLLLTLLLSLASIFFGWKTVITVCFSLSVIGVLSSFYPLHIQTGLWRLAHSKMERLDEREIRQTLESLRYAYIVFSITALVLLLALIIFELSSQVLKLVIFWILVYLAHTLPSSVLAWTVTLVPAHNHER